VSRFRDLAARLRDWFARVGDRVYVAFAARRPRGGGLSLRLGIAEARRSFWPGVVGFGAFVLILAVSALVIGGVAAVVRALVT